MLVSHAQLLLQLNDVALEVTNDCCCTSHSLQPVACLLDGLLRLHIPGVHFQAPPRCVVVVVGSHIQRIVLATEETTGTQQVSHRPIKCHSCLWSQRGTKVNGPHRRDSPLLRPTGIQIATKSYATLQAMTPTNIETVHQTSLLHIESSLDRLGLLSPTHDQRSQQQIGKITLQPVLINKSKFLKATHRTKMRKIEIPRSMVVEALSW